jgi:hypothetical protein
MAIQKNSTCKFTLTWFVCNNLTTGHICNDICKFIPGSLHQTNKCLTTANGIEDFEQDIKYPFCLLQGFTTSFADGDSEKLNMQIHFDTDSDFVVCNNLTTGHICNDICKFIPGSLHQTNKCLTTANGTGPCLQKGTVCLHLIDDNGVKHIFILDDFLYHLDSPVNLLSPRRLAEKFIDSQGNPDKQTRIESRNSTHVLT